MEDIYRMEFISRQIKPNFPALLQAVPTLFMVEHLKWFHIAVRYFILAFPCRSRKNIRVKEYF